MKLDTKDFKYCPFCGQKLVYAKEDGMFDGVGSSYCIRCGLIHRNRKLINIPFKERFSEPLKQGIKTMTSRTIRYGCPGDYFFAFGDCYVLTSVEKQTLGFIVDHWKEEGCDSKEDFLVLWSEIHPRRIFDIQDKFWTHCFLEVSLYHKKQEMEKTNNVKFRG
jgi:hypothetical protein